MIISLGTKKHMWQNPTPFNGKALNTLGIEENFLNIIWDMDEKSTANI